MSGTNPINFPLLLVAANDTKQRAHQVLALLVAKLKNNNIDPTQHANYQSLDSAIWTLDGRIATLDNMVGTDSEKVFSLQEAITAVKGAAQIAQQDIAQLP